MKLDMYPVLYSFGNFQLYTHGVMTALGALVGGFVVYFLAKKHALKIENLLDILIWSILAGFLGARLLYVVLYYEEFSELKEIFFIWYGGLVSYGGIVGGLLIAALLMKIKKMPLAKWFDLGIIGLMFGWAIGRIGCFLNGDSVGLVSQSNISIWGRIPTQLFESVWVILIGLACYFFLTIQSKKKLPAGVVFWLGIALYSLGRFSIDFFRDEKFVFIFKSGQIASLLFLVISIVILFKIFILNRKAV